MARLVNRTDRCGRYYSTCDGVRQCADPPGAGDARDGFLDPGRLDRHFRATGAADVVGVYSYGADRRGRWVAVDIDNHDDKADPNANRRYALRLYAELTGLGFRPLLCESNGWGGFHLWALLAEAVPAQTLRRFGLWVVRECAAHGVPTVEVFPRNEGETPWGAWLRVPGPVPN
jgi:hypothetical protein